jgi:hypothetical protein
MAISGTGIGSDSQFYYMSENVSMSGWFDGSDWVHASENISDSQQLFVTDQWFISVLVNISEVLSQSVRGNESEQVGFTSVFLVSKDPLMTGIDSETEEVSSSEEFGVSMCWFHISEVWNATERITSIGSEVFQYSKNHSGSEAMSESDQWTMSSITYVSEVFVKSESSESSPKFSMSDASFGWNMTTEVSQSNDMVISQTLAISGGFPHSGIELIDVSRKFVASVTFTETRGFNRTAELSKDGTNGAKQYKVVKDPVLGYVLASLVLIVCFLVGYIRLVIKERHIDQTMRRKAWKKNFLEELNRRHGEL